MSRLAKNPIIISDEVKVTLTDNLLNVEGKLGKSSTSIPKSINVNIDNNEIMLTSENKALLGTIYANIKNEIHGNSKGFEKKLELVGTGYKANINGKELVLSLGYSHDINFAIPESITITVEKNTNVSVTGSSKHL